MLIDALQYLQEMSFRMELANDTFRGNAYNNAFVSLTHAGTLDGWHQLPGIGKSIRTELEQVLAGTVPERLQILRAGGPPASLSGALSGVVPAWLSSTFTAAPVSDAVTTSCPCWPASILPTSFTAAGPASAISFESLAALTFTELDTLVVPVGISERKSVYCPALLTTLPDST